MRSVSPWWLLVIVVIFRIWLARDVLGLFVIGAVIAYAFSGPVTMAEKRNGWPRGVVVGIGYLIAIGLIAILLILVAAQAVTEAQNLASAGPDAVGNTLRSILGTETIDVAGHEFTVGAISTALQEQISNFTASPGDAIHIASQAGSFLLDTFLVLVVAFYRRRWAEPRAPNHAPHPGRSTRAHDRGALARARHYGPLAARPARAHCLRVAAVYVAPGRSSTCLTRSRWAS